MQSLPTPHLLTPVPRRLTLLLSAAALVLQLSSPSSAATLTQIGQWPNAPRLSLEPNAAYLDGDHLYVGLDDALTILDVSQPDRPLRLGTVEFPGSDPLDVYAAEGRAYAACGSEPVRVLDVADPAQPSLLATLTHNSWAAYAYSRSNWLYTAHNKGGLGFTSLSNLNVTSLGIKRTSIQASGRPQVVDQTAYVPTLTGLEIHRYANPTDFTLLGRFDTGGIVQAVEVVGTTAYLAAHDGLRILDVQHPDQIAPLGTFPTTPRALDLRVIDQRVCLACNDKVFRILNVADPTQPTLLGAYTAPGSLTGLEANATHAFLITSGLLPTLDIVSLEDPASPALAARVSTAGNTLQVSVSGNLACLADSEDGLRIVDLQDPTQPVQLAHHTAAGTVQTVASAGNLACIGSWAGMTVVDLSAPANPLPRGTLMVMMPPTQIRIRNDRAYVLTGPGMGELVVASLTNPDNPAQLGSRMVMDAYDLAVTDTGFAALALGFQGLEIVDARDPAAMDRVALHPTTSTVYGVDLQPQSTGFRAFLATVNGLEIVDFLPPTAPAHVGSWSLEGANARCVSVAGQHVYLASSTHLWVLDVTNAAAPELLASADGPFQHLALAGGQLCTASGAAGLAVWKLQNEITQPSLSCSPSPGSLLLDWQADGTGWVLQRSTDLANPNAWETIQGSQELTAWEVATDEDAAFFRLRTQ